MENMVRIDQFWHGKRVLITGHTGFKGSWLSLWLSHLGAQITGFALPPPTQPALFELVNLEELIESHIGDLKDAEKVRKLICDVQPEIIFHLAAQPLVRISYQNPIETFATNTLGLVHLLEGIRNCHSVKALVNVTTDKCYQNNEWLWGYRENDALGGKDPYSCSKACAELITSAYRHSFFNEDNYADHGLAIATARAGNVIGGGDWAIDRLVPDTLNAIARGSKIRIRNPAAIRPWQHVLEPLHGYIKLAEALYTDNIEFSGAWNFGPNDVDAKPVEWIVEKLIKLWGENSAWLIEEGASPHEASYLKLDSSKSRQLLGWRTQWNISEALSRTVDWHRAYHSAENMRIFCLNQITEYSNETQTTN